jgi:Flp pilus assembly protein TadD
MENVMKLYEEGLFQEVVHSIDLNELTASNDPIVAKFLAASYFQLGQYAEALPLLKEIESCFSSDSDYLSLYGACLRRCGDFEGARIQFELALQIKPNHAGVQNNYANLLIDLGELQQAESILVELLENDPSYSDAQVNLHRLRERQRIEKMKPAEPTALALSASNFGDPLMLAFGEDEVRRTRPKSNISTQIQSDLNGQLPSLKQQQVAADKLKLAMQAVLEGRYQFALQLCSQVHQSMPTSSVLFECLADAYIALQRFPEAEICLMHALQLGANSFKLNANLSSLLCIRRDFALAQHYLEQASSIDANNASLSRLRSQIANSYEGSSPALVRFDDEWHYPAMKGRTLN